MRLLRSIGAVVVGYAIFALSAVAFFLIVRQPAHRDAPFGIMLGSIVVGVIAALLGGYVAAWIAGRRFAAHGIAVAGVLALGAALSLASTLGHGAIWSQLAALLLMAPSAALGGWMRGRQTQRVRRSPSPDV